MDRPKSLRIKDKLAEQSKDMPIPRLLHSKIWKWAMGENIQLDKYSISSYRKSYNKWSNMDNYDKYRI